MIEEILEAREKRTHLLQSKLNSHEFVVTFGLNIPGENKIGNERKEFLKKYFFEFVTFMNKKCENINYDFIRDAAGYVYFVWMKGINPYEVKKMALKFEEFLGEKGCLFDIDVYTAVNNKLSRQDLAEFPKKCFLCDEPAKVCVFKQKHSYQELLDFVEKIIKEDYEFVLTQKYISEDIVKHIAKGVYLPGDRLKEVELAKKYNVSRTKIREVLKDLAEYEIITLKKSMGAEIRALTKEEILELTELRIEIKRSLFTNVFKNLNKSGYFIVKTIHDKLEKIDDTNFDLVNRWNKKFYALIFALSNKEITRKVFKRLEIAFSHISYCLDLKIYEGKFNMSEYHLKICETIMSQDEQEFLKTLQSYFTKLQTVIMEL